MIVVRVAATSDEADALVAQLEANGVHAMTQADFKASADLPSTFTTEDRCTVLVASADTAELARRVIAGEASPIPHPKPHANPLVGRPALEIGCVIVVLAGAAAFVAVVVIALSRKSPVIAGAAAVCLVALFLRARRPLRDAFFGSPTSPADDDA